MRIEPSLKCSAESNALYTYFTNKSYQMFFVIDPGKEAKYEQKNRQLTLKGLHNPFYDTKPPRLYNSTFVKFTVVSVGNYCHSFKGNILRHVLTQINAVPSCYSLRLCLRYFQ